MESLPAGGRRWHSEVEVLAYGSRDDTFSREENRSNGAEKSYTFGGGRGGEKWVGKGWEMKEES